jgi:hypothetical protein
MRANSWIVLLAAAVAAAGCIGTAGDEEATTQSADMADANLTAADEALFDDPRFEPHPDHELPTYTTIPDDAPDFWQPIDEREVDLGNLDLSQLASNPDGEIEYGSGIAVWGETVIVPGRSTGKAWIVDISDPAEPEILSEFEAGGRDVDTLAFPDGRLYAVFATDNQVVPVWNLTNPENPVKITDIEPERGSHNVEIAPGTPYLFNSAGAGGGATGSVPGEGTEGTAIYDLSDPEDPQLVQDFENGYSCHDITFGIWPDQDKHRAYCAGYDVTQIWDVSNVTDPEVVVNVPVHHGVEPAPSTAVTPYRFSHLAMPNADGSVLIVGDETGGGTQPGCDVHASQGPVTASGPVGNLYFYDVSDEENPTLVGQISPDAPALMEDTRDDPEHATASCTSHFGQLIPNDDDRDLVAIGFYARGVNLIDFTDPRNPEIVDQWAQESSTWDVWYYQGYLFTGDTQRGFDVLTLGG